MAAGALLHSFRPVRLSPCGSRQRMNWPCLWGVFGVSLPLGGGYKFDALLSFIAERFCIEMDVDNQGEIPTHIDD